MRPVHRVQHVARILRCCEASTKARISRPVPRATPAPSTTPPANSKRPSIPDIPTPSPVRPLSSAFTRSRALPWVLASLTAAGIGAYVSQLYIAARQPCHDPAVADLAQQKDVAARYDYTADSFDSEVGVSEALMGINRIRKKLAQQCEGHVLEVSCGTGRNLGYYDVERKVSKGRRQDGREVQSLTFVDLSPKMVQVCRKKWDVFFSSRQDKLRPSVTIRFLTASALDPLPPPPPSRNSTAPAKAKYDTILQTMGLCSTASPVALLTNMAAHLDTSNPNARILLLEHGRSYKPWLNNILDSSAATHAEIHGCWYNRDIGALVREAARLSGLEVVRERRHHWGTTWMFELKAGKGMLARAAAEGAAKERGSGGEAAKSPAGGLGGWLTWAGWK